MAVDTKAEKLKALQLTIDKSGNSTCFLGFGNSMHRQGGFTG